MNTVYADRAAVGFALKRTGGSGVEAELFEELIVVVDLLFDVSWLCAGGEFIALTMAM